MIWRKKQELKGDEMKSEVKWSEGKERKGRNGNWDI